VPSPPAGWFHSSVQDLLDLYRHNAWANRKVFDVALGQSPEQLRADAAGTRGSVSDTLTHLARVEYAYLVMMERRQPEQRETYLAHDLAWFRDHVQELGQGYLQLLASATADDLQRDMRIPWFDFPVTVRDGLLQVLSHSAQHRSQVLSWLSSQGVETPDLDYVLMLQETSKQ